MEKERRKEERVNYLDNIGAQSTKNFFLAFKILISLTMIIFVFIMMLFALRFTHPMDIFAFRFF
jgi:hypothetical protein